MTSERWQLIKGLLQAALEREPSQRAAFLDDVCNGDDDLRSEIESLLAAHQQAGSFIQTPAVEVAAELVAQEQTYSRVGQQIGPYQIQQHLGTGGMGDVYLAHDTRLGRQVALKLLPDYFVSDPTRVQRFQQEARAASALSHPNAATIHDVGHDNGINYIVMEYVQGQTLDAKINGQPLDTGEILDIALQVAEALEEAHSQGIIHRDIKSNNIMLTPKGQVKVLDFGLAKVVENDERRTQNDELKPPSSDIPHSAFRIPHSTDPGVVMGTVAYMSPEQAMGRLVDHRTDIFSLGVVMYEMATGRLPFSNVSIRETSDRTIEAEPEAITQVKEAVPPELEQVISQCLEMEAERRYQSAPELVVDLRNLKRDLESRQVKSRARLVRLGAALALLVMLGLGLAYVRRAPDDVRAVRSLIRVPRLRDFINPQISPDGTRIGFVARPDGDQLYIRSLDSLSAQPLAGTKGARHVNAPFWSPDGRSIGFFAGGKLKTIAASGGPVVTLCDVQNDSRGGAWNQDGVIIFALGTEGPLYRISASGGLPTPVTRLEETPGVVSHRYPSFLPDGRRFLYLGRCKKGTESQEDAIYVGSLDSMESKPVVRASYGAVYSQGYVLFVRERALMAQAFDTQRLETVGDPVLVAEEVGRHLYAGRAYFSVSENGFLAYSGMTGVKSGSQLTWFDRRGQSLGVLGDLVNQGDPHISPDEKRVIVTSTDPQTGNRDLWIYEVARGIRTRFTFDPANDKDPVWSPDGLRVVFVSDRTGQWGLYHKASSGVGPEELLFESNLIKLTASWSPDGRFVLYNPFYPKTGFDLWVLPLAGEGESKLRAGEPFPFSQTEFVDIDIGGEFSPDGRWIAFNSKVTGQQEVYVAPFPGPGEKVQISTAGGALWPKWRGDGKEIFYLAKDKTLMAAEVTLRGTTLKVGVVRPLFVCPGGPGSFDVSRDGQRFLVNTEVGTDASYFVLISNWTAEFRK